MARLELIVAIAKNFVIGNEGQIPWHLSEDLKHFKAITTGHPVVMGRRTFESIGRVLPNRLNIMVGNTFDKKVDGLVVVKSLDEAMAYVGDETLMVIGGARMYQEAMPKAKVLHLTVIDKEFKGDTVFPNFKEYPFVQKDCEHFHSDACDFDYTFETWVKD